MQGLRLLRSRTQPRKLDSCYRAERSLAGSTAATKACGVVAETKMPPFGGGIGKGLRDQCGSGLARDEAGAFAIDIR
jgi:hypothetical protein